MTKWQYRVVTVPADALEAELNRLGADHWEAVGTHFERVEIRLAVGVNHAETVRVTAVLKKPVS